MDGSTFAPAPTSPIASAIALDERPERRMNKREAAKALTRSKVRNAAEALFDTVGYDKATIRDIAAKAGMSTGAVFANFKDKLALYVDIKGHKPVTIEQGHELFHVMLDLIPELQGELEQRQAGKNAEPWAYLDALLQRAGPVVEAIKATAPPENQDV
ncbi:TetR/AcrR family transcriptional regulator [Brevundimonas sp. P7753]|uniref:TetR/AcrR family transcriptional regulator n=1 Tax=Brevundimonas sp. P7753 TaxID=2726982 RepID=UPI002105C027|nr:TetR/AcrR family transcriptional regulator [Brevundimonas sp. P7753]